MRRLLIPVLGAAALVACGTVAVAVIIDCRQVTVDFTRGRPLDGVTCSPHMTSTNDGLVWPPKPLKWQSEAPKTWVMTRPLGVGFPWAIPYRIGVSASVRRESETQPGESDRMRMYFRYGVDGKHWSSWIQIPEGEGRPARRPDPLDHHYSLAIPERNRLGWRKLRREWEADDRSRDMSRFFRWIEENHPAYLREEIAFVGYVQLLVEWPGYTLSRLKVKALEARLTWTLGGTQGSRLTPQGKRVKEAVPAERRRRHWQFRLSKRNPDADRPADGETEGNTESKPFPGATPAKE
jgi:hypothetical protein